ncbi:MAG TPA: Rne/Rng family ribonuclease [Candidatus Eisenbacteria bacterium]|jgi:ribonuclease G|nr:Rne/Rng family ribonuclease [Candidatus Eisenbacteria bacterium]
MRREIIINASPSETRIALLEDKQLVEVMVERPESVRRVGDIYKGRVNAVLPGMQAAFVDLGLEKSAFLHASDLTPDSDLDDLFDEEEDGDEGRGGRGGRGGRREEPVPRIEEALKKGQEVLVQVTKEPIGTKGPRVTTQVSLPGRFLVLMPGHEHIGVSRKIEDRAERARLKGLMREIRPRDAGVIVRTVGAEQGKKEFQSDVRYLEQLWSKIESKAQRAKAPALLHQEMEFTTGLIRDIFNEDVDQLVIDSREEHRSILKYLATYAPEFRPRVKLYRGEAPIFDHFEIESEIEKAMERKVWLKKGGYITIDQTEALVAIDVNTGRFTGKKSQEETILKTNIEAAAEIARQLRLRDLGGIIVLDFIDMEDEQNRKQVSDTLRQHLRRDRARTKSFAVSELGLIEMTRQRQRPSLANYFNEDCPECEGTGKVLSMQSAALKIERMLRRVGQRSKEKQLILRVHPDVAVHLVEQNADRLGRLERQYRYRVEIRDDPSLRRNEIRLFRGRTYEEITKQYER